MGLPEDQNFVNLILEDHRSSYIFFFMNVSSSDRDIHRTFLIHEVNISIFQIDYKL